VDIAADALGRVYKLFVFGRLKRSVRRLYLKVSTPWNNLDRER